MERTRVLGCGFPPPPRDWTTCSAPASSGYGAPMGIKRILVVSTVTMGLGIPVASAVGHGSHHSHKAKVRWATLKPVRADVAAYTDMRGKAQMTANRHNAKVSLHLKGMVPGATYPWAVAQGTDPATVCADGTPVTGLKYRKLKAGKSGNANSKAYSKKRAFTFDKTATYAVVVYQAGTTDEVLLCGVFKGKKPKKIHKHASSKKPAHHGNS
jgi:hypothetical protein